MASNEKTTRTPFSIDPKSIALFCLIGISIYSGFHLLTPTHNWGGDFAHYLHHAENLCLHKPYSQTYFIPNPDKFYGPPAYPPFFSLLLTPFYCIYQKYNLLPYKIVLFSIFLLASLFFTFWIKQNYSFTFSILCLSILLFNPYIQKEIYNQIISDTVFFALSLSIGIFSYERKEQLWKKMEFSSWILFSSLILISILTRSVGILFLFALFLYTLFHHFPFWKKIIYPFLICVSIYLLSWVIQHFLFQISTSPYWKVFFQFHPAQIITNVRWYFYLFRTQFGNWGEMDRLNLILGMLLSSSILFGFFQKLRTKPDFIDYFVLLYTLGVLIFWPIPAGFRFLLPIIPWLFLYLEFFITNFSILKKNQGALFSALALITIINSLIQYPTIRKSILSDPGPYTSEAQKTFDFIQNHTPPTARITFTKPRVLSLFTKRESMVWKCNTFPAFLDFLNEYQIDYILFCSDFEEDTNCLQKILINGNGKFWKLVHQNSRFQLYQITLRN